MGISFPWDDNCDDTIEVGDRTFKLIQGPKPDINILGGLYAEWDCVYQAQDGTGDIHTETHRRALWIFDF